MPVIDFQKPVKGIDQLSDETSLMEGTVREAENITIDKDGNFERRPGYTLQVVGSGYHSLYSSKRGWLLVCQKNVINILDPETFGLTPIVSMNGSYLTSFTEFNDNLYFVNLDSSGMFRVNEATVRDIGLSLPSLEPSFGASANGILHPGTYGVSYTVVDSFGEESGTGPIQTVELPDGGSVVGTMFAILPDHKWRIYMTTADGEELYQAAEFDADVASYTIGNHVQERQADTLHLKPLPYGLTIRSHGARIFIGNKDYISYSSAFRPHLHNPAIHFFPIVGYPYMMESVETGLFISDNTGVRFYKGNDASEFVVIDASPERAIFGTSMVVPGKFMNERFNQYDRVCVWLSQSGYQVGLPTGEVVALHKDQVKLPNYVQGCSAYFTSQGKRQLVTPVQSNELSGSNIAVDSSIM
jgi:hypothetical protein